MNRVFRVHGVPEAETSCTRGVKASPVVCRMSRNPGHDAHEA